jgi:hypothetical protein
VTCKDNFDEAMSLRLDGLLDAEAARELDEHISVCIFCGPMWAAMKEADALLWHSAAQPAPLPSDFHLRVMGSVTALSAAVSLAPAAVEPARAAAATPVPALGSMPMAMPMHLPGLTRPLGPPPAPRTSPTQELRREIGAYFSGFAVVALAMLGTLGLFLGLVVSGTLPLGGPFADLTELLQTAFGAVDTWVRSLFVGFGPATIGVAGLVLGLLVLVAWQVVANYYRFASSQRGKTAYLEALS